MNDVRKHFSASLGARTTLTARMRGMLILYTGISYAISNCRRTKKNKQSFSKEVLSNLAYKLWMIRFHQIATPGQCSASELRRCDYQPEWAQFFNFSISAARLGILLCCYPRDKSRQFRIKSTHPVSPQNKISRIKNMPLDEFQHLAINDGAYRLD